MRGRSGKRDLDRGGVFVGRVSSSCGLINLIMIGSSKDDNSLRKVEKGVEMCLIRWRNSNLALIWLVLVGYN